MDAGQSRPSEMLAVLFEKFWADQIGIVQILPWTFTRSWRKSPSRQIGTRSSKKLRGHFYIRRWPIFRQIRQYDKQREMVIDQIRKLSERVCAYEFKKRAAQANAAAAQARVIQAGDQAKTLTRTTLL